MTTEAGHRTQKRSDSVKDILDSRALLWLVQLLFVVILSVVGFLLNEAYGRLQKVEDGYRSLMEWRAETSGSRFTTKDGLELWQQIADLKQQIAILPKEMPPTWFVARVERLETSMDSTGKKLDEALLELRTQRATLDAMRAGSGGNK